MAIEAAQIATGGKVYAIEMDPEDHQLIIENARLFGVTNLVPVLGRAPEAWQVCPPPIASSRQRPGISRLVDAAYERLKAGGRLVATMGSVDNVAKCIRCSAATAPMSGLDDQPGPRQLSTRSSAIRITEPHVLDRRGQAAWTKQLLM